MRQMKVNLKILSIQIVLTILFFISWELFSDYKIIDPFFISSPSKIADALLNWLKNGILLQNLWITFSEAFAGLILGIILGVLFSLLLSYNKTLDKILQPFINMINALPRIAFAPLIVLWFGFGFLSKVIIVISLVFFIIFFNTYQGIREINPILIKNSKILGASKRQIFYHIYIPSIMSWVFASLRLSVAYSVIAAIIGEYVGSSGGIGFLIDNAQSMFDATGVMAGLIALTIVVAIFDYLIRLLENKVLAWKN